MGLQNANPPSLWMQTQTFVARRLMATPNPNIANTEYRYNYENVMPYVRIASLLICSRIGEQGNCTWYALPCDFPSGTAISEYICALLKRFGIHEVDVPTVVGATLELWCRMTHYTKLRYDFWQVTMCVVINLVGKVLDDEWSDDMNGWMCKQLQLNLKAFNKCEAAVCAALNYNLSLSYSNLSAFVDEVQAIHERAVKYIAEDYKLAAAIDRDVGSGANVVM